MWLGSLTQHVEPLWPGSFCILIAQVEMAGSEICIESQNLLSWKTLCFWEETFPFDTWPAMLSAYASGPLVSMADFTRTV